MSRKGKDTTRAAERTPDAAGPGFAARSDIGRVRTGNEDAFLARPPLFAVADGMGGANAGEVAAELAISHLEGLIGGAPGASATGVRAALEAANAEARRRAAGDTRLRGMGTTCTVALVEGAKVHIAHVGDSRAYLVRDGNATQLTTDHSLVATLVREGILQPEDAARDERRNVITRAIGVEERLDVDVQTIDVSAGDRVLLCSDGVSGMLSDSEIGALAAGDDLEAVAGAIVDRANAAGGVDNATVILIEPALVEVAPAAAPVEAAPAPVEAAPAPDEAAPQGSAPPAVVPAEAATRGRRAKWLIAAVVAIALLFGASFAIASWLGSSSTVTPTPTLTPTPVVSPSVAPSAAPTVTAES